jgi:antitoxin (DNA-binding transcriptional repressor) of toxin-antitoxin stability system
MKRIDLDDLPPKLAQLLTSVEGEEVLLVQNGGVAGRLVGGAPPAPVAPEPAASDERAAEIFENFRAAMEDDF